MNVNLISFSLFKSRFIINIPNEEQNIIRVLFQIELAYWFYIDFVIIEKPDLRRYNFKPFAKLMFNHVPFLRRYLTNFDRVIDEWRDYKHNVPTYGCIILDESMENVSTFDCLKTLVFYTQVLFPFLNNKGSNGTRLLE